MTKELAFREGRCDRTRVERQERTTLALAVQLVDGASDELLSGSRLTGDQDREVARHARLERCVEHRHHLRTLTDDAELLHGPINPGVLFTRRDFGIARFKEHSAAVAGKRLDAAVEHAPSAGQQALAPDAQWPAVGPLPECDDRVSSLLEGADDIQRNAG